MPRALGAAGPPLLPPRSSDERASRWLALLTLPLLRRRSAVPALLRVAGKGQSARRVSINEEPGCRTLYMQSPDSDESVDMFRLHPHAP